MMTPQRCPKCRASLADPSVPDEYRRYQRRFTVALEVDRDPDGLTVVWQCPFCGDTFRKLA